MSEVQLFVGEPRDVRQRVGWDRIQTVRFNYYLSVFGQDWGLDGIHDYISLTTTRSWDDPNNSARRSRRANPVAVVAQDLDTRQDIGLVYVADDASKTRRLPLGLVPGFIQEPLKLNNEKFVDKRWAWIREMIGDAAVSSGALIEALRTRHPAQPVSLYPYAGERALALTAEALRLEPDSDRSGHATLETTHPLGPEGPSEDMHRFTAVSASFVIHSAQMLLERFPDTNFRVQHV